jgi:hypothetical protein
VHRPQKRSPPRWCPNHSGQRGPSVGATTFRSRLRRGGDRE